MLRNFRRWGLALALALAGAFGPTFAQAPFPERPIRFVVAFVFGGASDTMAR